MQFHYSNFSQLAIPLICFHENESAEIKLETSVAINGRNRGIELVLEGVN